MCTQHEVVADNIANLEKLYGMHTLKSRPHPFSCAEKSREPGNLILVHGSTHS